jgi:hypothetical protein
MVSATKHFAEPSRAIIPPGIVRNAASIGATDRSDPLFQGLIPTIVTPGAT